MKLGLGTLLSAGAGFAVGGPAGAAIAAGGALGDMKAQRQQEQVRANNMAQAEMTRYSPWTGMRGQITPEGASGLEGAIGGGIQGAAAAQGLGLGAGGKTSTGFGSSWDDLANGKTKSMATLYGGRNPFGAA
ncbi:hypothetical protein D3C87_124910 [compost metagenome]